MKSAMLQSTESVLGGQLALEGLANQLMGLGGAMLILIKLAI
jgi:hypothetical protein